MYLYSIMPLDTKRVGEICEDIRRQQTAGVSNVALFMMRFAPEGTPPLGKASYECEKYDIFREKLDKMGLRHGVLVQSTLGHGAPLMQEHPFQKVQSLTEHGTERNVCCPLDPDYRIYIREQMRILAERHPACVMIDDDVGLLYRWDKGCTCPRHMAELSRRAGETLTREELCRRILGGDTALRELYIAVQEEALAGAVEAMREGLDSVDPSIQGIVSNAGNFCEGQPRIARAFAGKGNPVILRLNNGAYSPMGAKYFTKNMLRAAAQREMLRDSVDVFLAETDTCPWNRYSTSASSLHAHFTGSILEGATGAKHWITRLHTDEPGSGEAYRRILSKYAGFYEALSRLVPSLTPVGCRIPLSRVRDYLLDVPNIFDLNYSGWATCVLERLGLPLYFSAENGGAAFLDDDAVSRFSDAALTEMLRGTVIFSGRAAKDACDRGFASLLGVEVQGKLTRRTSGERLSVNGNTVPSQVSAMELVPLSDEVRWDSEIVYSPSPERAEIVSPGSTVCRNALGGVGVVFAGTPQTRFHYTEAFSFLCASRKDQLVRILRETGNLPVYYPGDADVYLRAGYLPDGSLLCAIFDLCLDPLEEITLVCEKPVTRVTKLLPDGSLGTCDFVFADGVLTVPETVLPLAPVVLLLQ